MIKKILIFIILVIIVLIGGIAVVHNKINVHISSDNLPQDVYQNDGDLLLIAQSKLLAITNPLSSDDEYTAIEEFMNYMLLYSIRKNVNKDYNPLGDDCNDDACKYIVATKYGNVEYIYASLTEENQLLVVVSFYRGAFPKTETALYLTFNIDISIIDMKVSLILDSVYLHDIEITEARLDQIIGLFDAQKIEDSVAVGELDLETYTYSVSISPF